MKKHAKLLLTLSVIVMAAAIIVNIILFPALITSEQLIYQNVDDNQIHANYIESENGKGVIIVSDIGIDKRNCLILANELKSNGYGVFLFDMPSQGTSEGNIPYHYNEDTILAEQFYNALVVYSQISQIPIENIHIIGYGQGARVALESAAYGYIRPKSMTLAGCSINFSEKLNYDIINYSDDVHISWIEELNDEDFSFPIHVISSPFDDVSSDEDNRILADRIGATYESVGFMPHLLLSKSNRIINSAMEFITETDNNSYEANKLNIVFVLGEIIFWIGLICALYFTDIILKNKTKYNTRSITQVAKMPKGFIKKKLLAYLPAILVGVIMGVGIYHIPYIEIPYKSLFYIVSYGAYAVNLMLLYSFTDFGRNLNKPDKIKSERVYLPFIVFALVLFAVIISQEIFSANPFAIVRKPLWQLALTMLFAIGFYIDSKERRASAFTFADNMALSAVNYLTVWVLPIVFTLLGLYSNAVGAIYNAMYLLCVLMLSRILTTLDCPDYLSAVLKGFLFQFCVFAQMVMFR